MFKDHLPIRETSNNEVFVTLKISPGAKQNKIGKCEKISDTDFALKIFVTAKPENGEANQAVIELLAKILNTSKSNIKIVSGLTSKIKVVKFINITSSQILTLFN